jgi:hypothetical protein
MITVKQFETLKKENASVNAAKTKARVPETFKSATTAQRKEIFQLSGFKSPNNFYATEKSGSASPKAVLSLAQVLNVNPFYLTGESDDKTCNEGVLIAFFKKCTSGNEKTRRAKPTTSKPISKKAATPKTTVKAENKFVPTHVKDVVKSEKTMKIDDVSLIKLLEALAIRAKYGGEAETTYNKVVELLGK